MAEAHDGTGEERSDRKKEQRGERARSSQEQRLAV
jgi:hypothetical protein